MDIDFHQLLINRHSIRRYKNEAIEADAVKLIIEAGLLAPSSKSSRPWQFVIVEDKDILLRLSNCKSAGALPLTGASMAIVICGDPDKSDVFVEDCSVAATFMQLQAAALGVGSCWIQIRNRYDSNEEPAQNLIKETLNIPDNLQVVQIVTLGIS
ncbi:MAG: nitroreductase family protein, partial [Muribaculaceae bacterium]|nr:nitroreductase family protein [Muribaculaceae bacterium]